jgi:hypothetical protein
MTKRYEAGDVHAPVEDIDVPFGLKVLVVFMIVFLVALTIALVLAAERLGLLWLTS